MSGRYSNATMCAVLCEWRPGDEATIGKLEANQKGLLLAQLEDVSATMAGQLVMVPVNRKVSNVRTLGHDDPSLIGPIRDTGPSRSCFLTHPNTFRVPNSC